MKGLCLFLFFLGFYHRVCKAAECTERGRYPSNDESDCRGYTMCLIGGTTKFTQYKLICPKGFIYSHREKQCTNVTGYNCFPSYNCTYPGNLVDPDSENCTSYIACVKGITELVTARLVQCPSNKVFSPFMEDCVNETEYMCNVKIFEITTENEIENDSVQFYDSFSYNGVIEVHVKITVPLCTMTILFVLQ